VRSDTVDVHQTLVQILPSETTALLRGQAVTYGAWVWSPIPNQVGYLQLYDGATWHTKQFTASQQWSFIAETTVVDPGAGELTINLNSTDSYPGAIGDVLYAGVVVVKGGFASTTVPTYLSGGNIVEWDGKIADNYVENSIGIQGGLTLKPFLARQVDVMVSVIPRPALIKLSSVHTYQDEGFKVYVTYSSILIDSFWAVFGWMNVLLPSSWYVALKVVTLAFVAGAILRVLGFRSDLAPRIAKRTAFITTLSLLTAVSGFALAFLHEVPPEGQTQGRYATPIVGPFAIILYVGLGALFPHRAQAWLALSLVVLMLALNGEMLLSAVNQCSTCG